MAKRMLIDALHTTETRVVITDEKQIVDFDFTSATKKQLKGNIYLAKITRVEPSLQAAFVEYGGNKQGFLPFSEIHPDYYQIPVSDRERLMREVENEQDEEVPAQTAEAAEAPETDLETPAEFESASEEQKGFGPSEETSFEQPAYMKQAMPDSSVSMPLDEPEAEEFAAQELPSESEPKMAENQGGESTPAATDPASETMSETADNKSPEGSEVETLANEEEEMRAKRKKQNFTRRYKIQEVIRRGQIVLVQVIKEERGNKGVSLTTYLSLAGRYCVLMPNSPKDGGISRKIASGEDRKRLKAISTELRLAKGMSVIIRTAGMDRTRAEIKRDYDYLVKVWNGIREETLKSTAPSLIYEESDVIKRAIRDQYSSDIDEIVVEGSAGYHSAKEFMKILLPSHTPKVKEYNEPTPLFYAYNIEDQLLSMHDPVVKLRSGGYIVINPTEALISIDVNSGRSTGERNIEETAAKTNLEAAVEVARQLRLRDLAGLIVIDFIDMMENRNRRAVEKALKDALKMDRAKIQLGRISPFGLLEMSRQRLRPSISETNMVQCEHCIGRGYVRSNESMSIQMIRALEKEASTGNWNGLRLILPQAVALHLLNSKRDLIRSIEQRHDLTIQVLIDSDMATSEFNLEKMRRSQSQIERNRSKNRRNDVSQEASSEEMVTEEIITEGTEPELQDAGDAEFEPSNDNRKGRSRRGRRGGRRNRERDRDRHISANENEAMEAQPDMAETGAVPEEGKDPQDGERRNNRGGRGRGGRNRRRWRDNDKPQEKHRSEPNSKQQVSNVLPAFATEERLPPPPEPAKQVESERVAAVHALPPTPRDPNAPAKKGWWQKMIELDD